MRSRYSAHVASVLAASTIASTTVATALAVTLTTPSIAGAQDRISVTIVAPTLGSFPQLTAGTFETSYITSLTGTGGTSSAAGNAQQTRVEMSLPWGGEAAQFYRALASGTQLTTVTCAFYHAGSSTPYYNMTLHSPTIDKLALAYDSAAGIANEEVRFAARQVDYAAGTSGTTTSGTTTSATPPTIAPRIVTIGGRQLHVLPAHFAAVSRIASAAVQAGPPTAGFAAFTASTGALPSEGGIPPWAGSQSTSVSRFAVEIDAPNRVGSTGAGAGKVTFQAVTFTKPLGTLSPQLQAARAAHTPMSTVISLADRPGRLAYRVTLANGVIQSDQTSFSGGKSAEDITMYVLSIQLDDLLHTGMAGLH